MRKRYPPDFEAFFKAYPVGDAKAAAFLAWQKTEGARPPLAELLAAIMRRHQHHEWLDANRKFVPSWPYAQGWLNGARWEDRCEIPTQRAQAPAPAEPSADQLQGQRMNELAHEAWIRIRTAVLREQCRPMFGWGHAAADEALVLIGGFDSLPARRTQLSHLQAEFISAMVQIMSAVPQASSENVVMLRRAG